MMTKEHDDGEFSSVERVVALTEAVLLFFWMKFAHNSASHLVLVSFLHCFCLTLHGELNDHDDGRCYLAQGNNIDAKLVLTGI